MQTQKSIESIISKVDYLDWKLRLGEMGDGWFVQVQFEAPDSESGLIETQHCRKWYVSKWMTDTEVVDTIYAAFERAVLHEFNETFRYQGRAIYNPHTSTEARYESCIKTEHREPNQLDETGLDRVATKPHKEWLEDEAWEALTEVRKTIPKRKLSVAEIILAARKAHKPAKTQLDKVYVNKQQLKDLEKWAKHDDGPVAITPLPNQMSFLE